MALSLRRKTEPKLDKDAVLGAMAKAIGAMPPASRAGKAVNIQAVLAAAAAELAPTLGQTPDDIVAALTEAGMDSQGAFSPGAPLKPFFGYDRDPRSHDFVTGRNITSLPRSDRLPFETLKALTESYDVAGICNRHVISDLQSMQPMFTTMDGVTDDVTEDIAKAVAFWKKPDGKRKFRQWLAMWWQDILRFDAGSLYKRRSLDGQLITPWSPAYKANPERGWGVPVISGMTIAPVVDYFGDIPGGKAPAYVQFINGLAWDWISGQDLVYEPFTPFPESVYGLPPIETVLLNANTDIRFQWHFANYFMQGNVPDGFVTAPPDQSTPSQIEEWQEFWDSFMLGDQTKLRQLKFVPYDTKYIPTKSAAFDEKFPEYLMRRTVAAYGLVPHDLGFTDDVNRATGDTQMDVQFRISTTPRVGYIQDVIDEINQVELHLRVKCVFDTGQEKEDRLQEAQAWQIYCQMGSASPDEPREKVLGLPVNPEEMVPRTITTRSGLVPIKNLIEIAGIVDAETGAPAPGSVTPLVTSGYVVPTSVPPAPGSSPPGATPPAGPTDGGEEPPPPSGGGGTPAPAAPTSGADAAPLAKAETAGLTADTGIAGDGLDQGDDEEDATGPDFEELTKSLEAWKVNTKRRLRSGKRARLFDDLPRAITSPIWERLEKAETSVEVDDAFAVTVAGLCVKAADTGRILMLQRSIVDDSDPARGTWEFPGGHLDDDEEPLDGALREWSEEVGCPSPDGTVADTWTNGIYQGFVWLIDSEASVEINLDGDGRFVNPDDPDGDDCETVAWWDPVHVPGMPGLRTECNATPWQRIFDAGKVVKAESPKGDWAGHPAHPFHEKLVEHYSKLIAEASKKATSGIKAAVSEASEKLTKAEADPAQDAVEANVTVDRTELANLLHEMMGDAYLAGAHVGAEQIGGGAVLSAGLGGLADTVKWDTWEPGWGEAAAKDAKGGLKKLLDSADVTIKGLDDTTLERLGNALASGLASGDSVDSISSDLEDIVGDSARADMIANTEVARAMTQATIDTYEDNGVTQFNWVLSDGACPACEDEEAANPHDLGDTTPPEHPNCRCAVSPIISGGS